MMQAQLSIRRLHARRMHHAMRATPTLICRCRSVRGGRCLIFCCTAEQRDRHSRTDFCEPLKAQGARWVQHAITRRGRETVVRCCTATQEARTDRTRAARLVGRTKAAGPCLRRLWQSAAAATRRFAASDSVVLRRGRRLRLLGCMRSVPDAARTGAAAIPLRCGRRHAARCCDRKCAPSATPRRTQPAAVAVVPAARRHTPAMRARRAAPWPAFRACRCRFGRRFRSWQWCQG